ncbi:hypothetical protein FYZ48_00240 [Gimesia chilikensis]|uniref:hypothetical protein n=1 Tax=Gimesia chilikensis TaxID=2605989 RepID=UPI0011EEC80A|nr:hypothetical protein [Gimesia chilikensis]KAA0142855.1 hypothetical protein FYZ48_00240 [Gimesia chilikensis]
MLVNFNAIVRRQASLFPKNSNLAAVIHCIPGKAVLYQLFDLAGFATAGFENYLISTEKRNLPRRDRCLLCDCTAGAEQAQHFDQ